MKKKLKHSEEESPAQPAADYVVGQVAGSLFQTNPANSGSLSALFSTAPPAAPLLFQPAPKPVQKTSEPKQQTETPEVKAQLSQKQKKPSKEKTSAEQNLDDREISLQNADDSEQGPKTPKKKKRKISEVGGEEEEETGAARRLRLKAKKRDDASKMKRTVFVGNLPTSCTKKTLQSLFKDDGTIESIRFRSVVREDPSMSRKLAAIKRQVHPKKQNINAYIVFKDEEAVSKALERNGTEIENAFHIRVDGVSRSSAHDHKRSVFVGNLSFEISERALRQHFDECGEVEAVRLVRDKNSGMGKGFGYVLFESADSVQLALELDGSKLEGRSVRVKRSVKKEKVKNKMGNRTPGKMDSRGGPGKTGAPGGRGAPRNMDGRGSWKERGGGQGPFKPPGKFNGKQNSNGPASFKGEMANPNKKPKKKGLKKKQKAKKTVHI
ncbi:RNA-binding protein 34 [Genypterus blacodes]|uniref:RNA-binding protein 34 n=1 Tax=Genypterus blacodes TaxID=154954 RepID=UPI003F770293